MRMTESENGEPLSLGAAWVLAVRESLVALLPLTLLGALASVFAFVPSGPYTTLVARWLGSDGMATARLLMNATIGIMGLATAMVVAMRLSWLRSPRWASNPGRLGSTAAVAAAAFLVAVMPEGVHNFRPLGYNSILSGLAVGIGTAELLVLSARWIPRHERLHTLSLLGLPLRPALRMSEQALLVLAAVYLARLGLDALGQWLSDDLLLPCLTWLQSLQPEASVVNLLLILANQLLWLVGCNGGQVLLDFAAHDGGALVLTAAHPLNLDTANLAFLNAFAHLGGAGATWGLVIACLVGTRERPLRQLAMVSAVPALLNVNELLLFGIPLVFSRVMLVPFILAPMLSLGSATLAIRWLHLPLDGLAVVWSTPVLVSGFLMTGSAWGAAIQLMGIALATLVYLPFVRRLEKLHTERRRKTLVRSVQLLSGAVKASPKVLDQPGELGNLARALVAEFRQQLGGPHVQVVYQPQHDIEGRLVGAEALLHWEHPLCGVVPSELIASLAEECDLIHSLGAWVLEQACQDLKVWRGQSPLVFPVSVNMSPVQLEDPGWPGIVEDCLNNHGLLAWDLELEVTEGRRLSSSPEADRGLMALQAMEVRLAMDDFGMGCTSLLYLQRFRVHMLKLDGSLTCNITNEPVKQDIVRAICELSAHREVIVTAEYVEEQAQRDLLHRLGCTNFQGWLYSKAISATEFTAYLDRQRRTEADLAQQAAV